MIVLTCDAISALRTLVEDGLALRISAAAGGCAGIRYGLSLEDTVAADDQLLDHDGVRVVADAASAELLTGATLDFVEGAEGPGFVFDNPGFAGRCSCRKGG